MNFVLFSGGFALGSILFQFCGIQCPFYVIAALNIVDAILRLLIVNSDHQKPSSEAGLKYALRVIRDRDIVIALRKINHYTSQT